MQTDIELSTVKGKTTLTQGGRIIYAGGRVAAKKTAKRLHMQTGCRVFNRKAGGNLVLIHPTEPQK